MSRFFRRPGDESSSESSSDDEELYANEDEEQQSQEEESEEDSAFGNDSDEESSEDSDDEDGKKGASRFLRDAASDSSDSDDEVRAKVKSAKLKRLDELESSIKLIENGQKNGDWSLISAEFDKLNRQVTKLQDAGKTPKPYVKVIADLEDLLNETIAKQKVTPKKMNAIQARGLNAVKQKIKKTVKDYQDQVNVYREDKDTYLWTSDPEDEDMPVPKPKKTARFEDTAAPEDEAAADLDDGFATVGKGGRTLQYTPESIFKHLRGIMESRGKKNTDRSEQIKVMEKLNEIANTPYQKIRVLLTLVSARFDLGTGTSNTMPLDHWKAAEKELSSLLVTLNENKEYVVLDTAEEWDDDEKPPALQPGEKYIKVAGSIVSYIERLDDELHRSLQSIDPHTSEYIERLQDEGALYNIIFRGLLYYEDLKKDESLDVPQDSLNRIVMRRLEHVYFKPAQVVKTFEENCWKTVGDDVESLTTPRDQAQEPTSLVNVLCGYLYTNSEGILRARALLCQVYFLALHDEYYKARDMMLMSHLQETVASFDVLSQILYNRTLVQVGLCAFRRGLVYDAQNTLQEICGSGRQKELLAQGVMMQRYNQVSPEQERLEKQRQLPFHMHINLELLECVYLTCSMLLEIPLLAQTGSSPDIKKRVISKTYRRMLEYHERQIFTGPPRTLVTTIKIWDLMPNTEEIKTMLSKQIQEEGLRTYLFTYAPFYDTLAIETLSGMFELDSTKTAAIISKMISHEELAASLDQVTSNVIFRKGVELSRLQSLALTLSDKASALIETNERTLEQRTQGTSNAFERQGGRGRGGHRGGARGGRGGPRGPGNAQRQAGGTQFTGGALGAAVRG
ncbi:Eukaryotic translation initiation factor 3 subunit C [Cladobotryum mycophilum]|uniref:Eukaryotic translation initiation factor 3 subunit C n=1 Tax=Cladobotryum mycophilum TaxID=491253 RepID=A0ABR0T0E1_9HYPO